jgi:hypothetical protein
MDPAGEVLGARQRITLEEALYLYTMGSAYASFEEDLKGSITPGKVADLVVLGGDPRRVDPDEIKDIPVDMIIIGGDPISKDVEDADLKEKGSVHELMKSPSLPGIKKLKFLISWTDPFPGAPGNRPAHGHPGRSPSAQSL